MLGPLSFMLRNQRRTVLLRKEYIVRGLFQRERETCSINIHTHASRTPQAHITGSTHSSYYGSQLSGLTFNFRQRLGGRSSYLLPPTKHQGPLVFLLTFPPVFLFFVVFLVFPYCLLTCQTCHHGGHNGYIIRVLRYTGAATSPRFVLLFLLSL